jgi:hypothetical protein
MASELLVAAHPLAPPSQAVVVVLEPQGRAVWAGLVVERPQAQTRAGRVVAAQMVARHQLAPQAL